MSEFIPNPAPTHKPSISLAETQPSYAVGRDTYTFVMTGSKTKGQIVCFDGIIPPGGGPPPHHHGYEELLFVLSGELTVFCENARNLIQANCAINVPGWAPHMLKNYGDVPVRIICVTSPSGLDEQFEECGIRVPHRDSPPPQLSKEEEERIGKLFADSSERHNAHLLPIDMFDHLIDSADKKAQKK